MSDAQKSLFGLLLILGVSAALVLLIEERLTFYIWCVALWLLVLNFHDFGHALMYKLLGGGFSGSGLEFNWLGSPHLLSHYLVPLATGAVINVYNPAGAIHLAAQSLGKFKQPLVYLGGSLICWLIGMLLFGMVPELFDDQGKLFWQGFNVALFASCMQCALSIIPIPPSDCFLMIVDVFLSGKTRETIMYHLNPVTSTLVSILVYVGYSVLAWIFLYSFFFDISMDLASLFHYEGRAAAGAAGLDFLGLSRYRHY